MKKRLGVLLSAALCVALFAGCSGTGGGQPSSPLASGGTQEPGTSATQESNPLAGMNIEWLTPNPAGDLFDTSVRMYVPFLEKYLPGTKFTVVNMEGGGGITAYNYVYKADSVTLASGSIPSMFSVQYIAKDEAVKFDMKDFRWIAYNDNDTRCIVTGATTGYETIYDLLNAVEGGKQPLAGAYGKAGQGWNEDVVVDYALNLGSKFVAGYNSSTILLALLQGEVDYTCGSYSNYKTNIESGDLRPLLVLETERSEECPDVPTIYELIDELKLDNADLALDMLGALVYPKLTFANPSTTDEQWAALCEAFEKVMADEEAMKLAADAGLHVPKDTGKVLSDMINASVDSFVANGDEIVAVFQQYLDDNP